jgi:alkylhydroperoxidase family enzyme
MTTKISDPHAGDRDAVLRSVLDGPGETDPSLRYAAAEGVGVPDDLRALVEKVHQHAYRVTDEEIAALQAKYGDDQLFEIIVSAALGASRQRLMAGLRALEEA